MIKLSQRVDSEPIDKIITYLIKNTTPIRLKDATHDAILIEQFFTRLPESFKQQAEISEEDVREFVKSVNLRELGISEDGSLRKKILNLRNIDRILDIIANAIPDDKKTEIVKKHLRETWFEKNSNGDYNHFLKNINWKYWGVEPFYE